VPSAAYGSWLDADERPIPADRSPSGSCKKRGSGTGPHYTPVQATVCLPTYNERENVEPMVRALGEYGVRVLVIDDNSPDGTGEIADRLAAELGYVDVVHRAHKEGLGPAYLAGFRRAVADGAELVLELDCDFSHNPADVPRLIAEAEAGADLVLGSRYVRGGSIGSWGPVRRFVSAAGSLYARVLLGASIRDLTGGFKCYRRAVLEAIDLDAIASKGYAFQIETTYRALRAGFRVVEVPIHFVDREEGGSKMTRAIVAEAIWKVPALRLAALRGQL
jgi:dolichol-phosphate mannosyltransferase